MTRAAVGEPSAVTTFLFTDIEGSTSLWEREPERMRDALLGHDRVLRAAVEHHRGQVVKMMGDGMHAAFADPLDAVLAVIELQQALADPAATAGVALAVRCGLHVGAEQRRDDDFFGRAVNRAARVMGAAHGGQALLTQAAVALLAERLPPQTSLRDLGLVRLRDLASPEHVYQLLHPGLRRDFPALRTLAATPNNLPQQLTSFIGRERELGEARALLSGARLLTLTGAGGIGKTRLASQLAAEVMDDYPDGVWLIELAALGDPLLVAQAAASVLGVKEDAGRPVLEALVRALRERRLLLILDNCEHLREACAELALALLQAGPQVKIAATSREALHVSGEAIYAVPALNFPGVERLLAPGALAQYEALSLFVERASAAQPAFAVTEANATAVVDICQRLEGIPLAIELAAARTRALSVETIAARLDDRFRLLKRGDGTVLPRQQTLRALIDWSYDLLGAAERALFRRLSVFAGGFTLEAAESVGAGGALDEAEVLDTLTELVEKSLVMLDPQSGRYRMLETVRQYAAQRLDEAGEASETRTRHLREFVALAEKARPEMFGAQQAFWLVRLDVERENLLAAHAWCVHAEDGPDLGLRLAHAVKPYWLNRGLLELGHRVTTEAVARAVAKEDGGARCGGLADAGQLSFFMGRYGEARGYLEESLAIARRIEDVRMVAAVLQPLGMACLGQGEGDIARGYLEEGVALARSLGHAREIAAALNALAQLHRMQGNVDAAEPLYEEFLALARSFDDREFVAVGILNLAMVAISRDAVDRVPAMLLEVLAISDEIGSKPAAQGALDVAAGLGAARRQWSQTALFFGAVEACTRETGLHRDPADEAFLAPLVARARDALGDTLFAAAEAEGRALPYASAVATARAWLERGA